VPENRLDEVKRLAKAAVEKIKMGDPRDKDVTLGPLASTKQYKRVQEFIKCGVEEDAELVIGGEGHPQGLEGGNFVKPTVFANVTRDMRIAKEEIFGPVLSILTYKTEAEAIEIANDTEFGLIAYVSSADPERAHRVARKLAAGRVLINTVSHDPFAPFGGFKQSGIGREGGIFLRRARNWRTSTSTGRSWMSRRWHFCSATRIRIPSIGLSERGRGRHPPS
jgi:aldehyde dehydrogenase (NAD+)